MDTSETYIKMHLALPRKLQEEPREGDYYYDKRTGDVGSRMGEVYFPTDKMIKLYEQDQLQEMVATDRGSSAVGQFGRLHSFLSANPKLQSNEWSAEQLWLMYLMRWEYNEVWNGDDWVLAKDFSHSIL